jgi:hypothetical protein
MVMEGGKVPRSSSVILKALVIGVKALESAMRIMSRV